MKYSEFEYLQKVFLFLVFFLSMQTALETAAVALAGSMSLLYGWKRLSSRIYTGLTVAFTNIFGHLRFLEVTSKGKKEEEVRMQ